MPWPLALLIALLAGVIALACMLPVSIGLVDWYRISGREGASGYFVIFCSLLAGLIGAIIGCFVARQAGPGFGNAMLWAAGVNVLLCALIAGIGYLFAPDRDRPDEVDLASAQAEFEAAQQARSRAEFDAVPADAPIEAWFPYLGNDRFHDEALRHIQAKPGHVTELAVFLNAANSRAAAEAFRVIHYLPKPIAPELKAAVVSHGKVLADLIRRVNETPEADDPGYELAAEASFRFSAWIGTARLLREPENGGTPDDFVPELLEILELSRVRPEIHVMRQDVLRVASHYAEKWAGVAPLPGDPPPN
jgi:CheY-like chemotaxis protein